MFNWDSKLSLLLELILVECLWKDSLAKHEDLSDEIFPSKVKKKFQSSFG